jgi:F-type H+-transporting ATPase subunit c
MTKKLVLIAFVLLLAMPAFAQATDAAPAAHAFGNWTFAAIGLGIAVGLAGLGQGRIAAAAAEGIARNPGAGGAVQTAMIIGLAFVESLVLFIWVMLFLFAKGA